MARPLIACQGPWAALGRRLAGGCRKLRGDVPPDAPGGKIRALTRFLEFCLVNLAKHYTIPPPQGSGLSRAPRAGAIAGRRGGTRAPWSPPEASAGIRGTWTYAPKDLTCRTPALRRRDGEPERLLLMPSPERILARQKASWNRQRAARALSRHRLLLERDAADWELPLSWWQQTRYRVRQA